MTAKELKAKNLELKEVANRFKADLTTRCTHAEEVFKRYLEDNNIDYQFQRVVKVRKKGKVIKFYIVDFFIPKYNLIIELDGEYHNTIQQFHRDKSKDLAIRKLKYWVLRLENHIVYNKHKLESVFNYAEQMLTSP